MKLQLTTVMILTSIALATSVTEEANPLSKTIDLLDALATKIEKAGEAEAKAYKDFFEWCDDASTNKGFEIKTGTAKKAKLEAAIAEAAADMEADGSKIDDLATSIGSGEADLKNAAAIREKESQDFVANEAELLDVIETLSRAISILSKEMAKNPAAFAQLDSSNLDSLLKSLNLIMDAAAFPSNDQQKLVAFVQARHAEENDEGDDDMGAPSAASYKTHTGGIVDVLEDMKDKAAEELSSLRKAEVSAKHNFQMLKQSIEDQVADDKAQLEAAKSSRGDATGAEANAKGDLEKTIKELKDAKETLETTNANCMRTAADHDASVKARSEELKMIAEGKKILVSTTGGAESQTYSLVQVKASSKDKSHSNLARSEVVTVVKRLAKQQHSVALSQLASRIVTVLRFGAKSGSDPFVKVKGLISDLVARLEAEAKADATEKAYCDEQMAKTEEKKQELEGIMKKVTSKIDQAAAKSAGLKEEVKDLQAELAALAKEQDELDKVRSESHANYVKAKAELEQGLEGVRKALTLLRNFYGSKKAAAFFQGEAQFKSLMEQPEVPQHAKADGAGGSIIGILEVVESDFAKNLATEEAVETDAVDTYDKVTQENKVTKTMKEADVKYKTQEFKGLDKAISDLSSDKEGTSAELNAVLEYYAKVKERCVAKPEAYAERKKRREAEIAGLKEALNILESDTALLQRQRRGTTHTFLSF